MAPMPAVANTGRAGGDDSIHRDRWGRPVVPHDGRPTLAEVCTKKGKDHLSGPHLHLTRATTLAKALDDTENLSKWRERQVAIGMSTRRDLQLKVSTNLDDPNNNPSKAEIQQAAEDAKEFAGSTAAATIGTALHAMAEKINRGEDPGHVPDDLKPRLKAYYLATRGFEWLSLEKFTVNVAKGLGGTPDGIARCPDGVVRIVDLKTSSSDVQYGGPSWGLQLAIYQESEFFDGTSFTPLPEGVDDEWGWIIHLPSNGVCADGSLCQIYRVPLDHAAIDQALQVRAWRARSRGGVLQPVPVLAGPAAVQGAPVVGDVVDDEAIVEGTLEPFPESHVPASPSVWSEILAPLDAHRKPATGDEPRPVEDHAPATASPVAAERPRFHTGSERADLVREVVQTAPPGQLGPALQAAAAERRAADQQARDEAAGDQVKFGDVVDEGPDNPIDTPDEISQAIAVASTRETLIALRTARLNNGWQPEHDELAGVRMKLIRNGMV